MIILFQTTESNWPSRKQPCIILFTLKVVMIFKIYIKSYTGKDA